MFQPAVTTKTSEPLVELFRTRGVEVEEALKSVASGAEKSLSGMLRSRLNADERMVKDWVDHLEFADGTWSRRYHNQVVPLIALAHLAAEKELKRDLIFAAISHDVGYSKTPVLPAAQGVDWDRPDLRREHMRIGAEMLDKQLQELLLVSPVSAARRAELIAIVANHDNPYIKLPLPDNAEHRVMRDWDRAFVPTAVSFFKDLLGYANNPDMTARLAQFGLDLSVHTMVLLRLAAFCRTTSEMPRGIDQQKFPLRPELAELTPAGVPEPQRTKFGKQVVDQMMWCRASEELRYTNCTSTNAFVGAMLASLERERFFLSTPR